MPADSDNRSLLSRFREWAAGPPMQASLFHSSDVGVESSIWPDLWNFLRHPIRSILEERHAPRTRASLFSYYAKPEERVPLNWKELIKDLFTEYQTALFIPSLWSNQDELVEERAELRTRRMESTVASIVVHGMVVGMLVFLALHKFEAADQGKSDPVVFISTPMNLPPTGPDGGGGGGGGRHDTLPPTYGRIPDLVRAQYMPPEPGEVKPLVPSENPLDMKPTVQMPIDLPDSAYLYVGDMTGPPGDRFSYGPGSGGGIGTGTGTGIGSGKGPGYGPGEGGGMGGGRGGGIGNGVGPYIVGNGVSEPVPIFEPRPAYTEEARKNRTEGILVLSAIIRKDGTVDSLKVVKGLGYGLDESAINTISTKWKFVPGKLKGIPVDVQANIEVTFRLY